MSDSVYAFTVDDGGQAGRRWRMVCDAKVEAWGLVVSTGLLSADALLVVRAYLRDPEMVQSGGRWRELLLDDIAKRLAAQYGMDRWPGIAVELPEAPDDLRGLEP
jgi:hypothetical protein